MADGSGPARSAISRGQWYRRTDAKYLQQPVRGHLLTAVRNHIPRDKAAFESLVLMRCCILPIPTKGSILVFWSANRRFLPCGPFALAQMIRLQMAAIEQTHILCFRIGAGSG